MQSHNDMEITFLGTGTSTGVPVVACNCDVCKSQDKRDTRLRTSVMVSINGHNLIVDCGPDFRYQMIRENVEDISAILFTHGHRDHIAGLDDVRAFNYVLNKTVDIFATEQVIEAIKIEMPYIITEKRFFAAPQLSFHIIGNKAFDIEGIHIVPIEALHHQMNVFGFRFGDFTYITDANYISAKEIDKIRGSKILVLNALRKSKHISHFSMEEAVEIIEEIKPEKAYLTHISHFLGLHEKIEKELPPNIYLAYDGLKLRIPL